MLDCLINGIVLDIALGVVVFIASVLDLNFGGPMLHGYIYAYVLDVFGGSSSIQGINCSIELGVYLPSIYRHCPRSSSGCRGMQGICARVTGEGHMKCIGIQGIYA